MNKNRAQISAPVEYGGVSIYMCVIITTEIEITILSKFFQYLSERRCLEMKKRMYAFGFAVIGMIVYSLMYIFGKEKGKSIQVVDGEDRREGGDCNCRMKHYGIHTCGK